MTKEGLLTGICREGPWEVNCYALRQIIQQHILIEVHKMRVDDDVINLMEYTKVEDLPEFLSCTT